MLILSVVFHAIAVSDKLTKKRQLMQKTTMQKSLELYYFTVFACVNMSKIVF